MRIRQTVNRCACRLTSEKWLTGFCLIGNNTSKVRHSTAWSALEDAFKSAKWDELTHGRTFTQSDAPALSLLCQWYKIAETAQDELDSFGGQTAYNNDMGDLKAFPQISTLKTASAEIRQLNKQLGICDTHEEVESGAKQTSILSIVSGNRAKRQARTA